MPKYQIEVPGQGTFEVESPTDLTDAQAYAAVQNQISNTPKPDNSSDFIRGFKSYMPQTKETFGGVQTLIGAGINKALGEGPVSTSLMERGAKNIAEANKEQAKTAKESDSLTSAWEQGIGTVLTDWLPYQMGSGAANILETAATALGGAALGTAIGPEGTVGGFFTGIVGKSLVKKGVKEAAEKILKEEGKDAAQAYIAKETEKYLATAAGRKAVNREIGSLAGMVGQAGFHGAGETTSRALQERQQLGETATDLDLSRLLPAAGGHAIADFIANKIGLGALDGLAKPTQNMLLNVAKGVTVTGAKEVPPELFQSAMERFGAQLPLSDRQAIQEYIDTAGAAFGMSVVPGGIGGIRAKAATQTAPASTPPAAPPAGTQGALFPEGGPTPPTAPAFDEKLLPELRQQYDVLEREIDRLAVQHQQEQDPVKKQAILVQAQKLDFARRELEGQLQGAEPRPGTAPVAGQAELDFTQPFPKGRLQAEPTVIGETKTTPDQQALDLEFAKQRLEAGAPLTPAQQLLLRQQKAPEGIAPQLVLPTEVGAGARPTSFVVDEKALNTFGFSKAANKIRNELRGLDLMKPEDLAKFEEAIAKHERKNAKVDMQAVEDFKSAIPQPVPAREVPEAAGLPAREYTPRQQYQQAREAMFAFGQQAAPISPRDRAFLAKQQYEAENGPVPEVGAGTSEPSVSLPSGELQPTGGVTAPATTGLASPLADVGRPAARTRPTGKAQPTSLDPFAQMVQQVAPEGKAKLKGEKVARFKADEDINDFIKRIEDSVKLKGDLQGRATIELTDRITQGDLKGALQELATSKQFSPLDNLVAKRLLQSKSLPKVEIVDPSAIEDGAAAQYNPNTDTVQIAKGSVDSHTVLHETVHAFLHVMIRNSEAREAKGLEGNSRLKSLKDVYNHVKKTRPDLVEKYGMQDLSEFASEAMSNPDFQNDLRNTPYRKENVLFAFGRAVLKLMGINLDQSNIANIDALTAALISAERAMPTGRKMQEDVQGGVRQEVAPTIAKLERQIPRYTKLAEPSTVGNSVRTVLEQVNKANRSNTWENFRIAAVDPSSGLGRVLASLPENDKQLRADLLARAFAQVNNVINNGLQTGIPVLSSDGSVVIKQGEDALAKSRILATQLDSNPEVQATGLTGMDYIAEIARRLRGKEIMDADAEIRKNAQDAMKTADRKMKESKNPKISHAESRKLYNEAMALRKRYKDDLTINRELEVKPEDVKWAQEQVTKVPEVKAILDMWRNINEGLIDLREAGGLLNKEEAAALRKNVSYVPLFAAEEDLESMRDPNRAVTGSGTKSVDTRHALKGTDKLQRNIWENLYKQYAITTAAVFQNQVRKIGSEQVISLGGGRFVDNAAQANVRYRDATSPHADSNGIVNAVVDSPNALAAFQVLHYELNPVMKAMAASTRLLRAGALINPMYWVKQLIRDPLHAIITGRIGLITPADSIKEFINVLRKNSKEAEILASHGVIGAVDSTLDLETFLKQVGEKNVDPSKLDKVMHKVMRIHEASDAATRVAIYKKSYSEAIERGMNEEQAISYGVMKARESANFSVHGNSATLNTLRHMIPFFSAAITSLDTLYRASTGYNLNPEEKAKAKQMFRSRATTMAVMAMVYAMMLQDDEEYKKLPDEVKDANWLLPNPLGDGKSFIKIPVPFEVGFLFKTIPETVVRYLAGNSTGADVLKSYRAGILQNLPGNGIPIPQAGKPILEHMTNYSFFTGRSLESSADQGLPVHMRGSNASETAKSLSKAGLDKLGLSPVELDNYIQGYTAQLGTFATSLADVLINTAEGKSTAAKNIEQLPGFRAFMTNPNVSKAVGDFYTLQREAVEVVHELNQLKKYNRRDELKEFLADDRNKKLIAIEPTLRRIQTQMATLRTQAKIIEDNQALEPEVRRARVNMFMDKYHEVAKQYEKVVKAAKL